MYAISQIIEIIAFIIILTAYHLNSKKKIFKRMCKANILEITHYLLLGAYSGSLTKVIALLRNIFIIKKENNQKINSRFYLLFFIFLYIIAIVITFKNIYSTLPIIAAIIYMIFITFTRYFIYFWIYCYKRKIITFRAVIYYTFKRNTPRK